LIKVMWGHVQSLQLAQGPKIEEMSTVLPNK